MSTDESTPEAVGGSVGRVGAAVGLVLIGVCLLVAVSLLLSFLSVALTGVGLAFWPAVVLAALVCVGLSVATRPS